MPHDGSTPNSHPPCLPPLPSLPDLTPWLPTWFPSDAALLPEGCVKKKKKRPKVKLGMKFCWSGRTLFHTVVLPNDPRVVDPHTPSREASSPPPQKKKKKPLDLPYIEAGYILLSSCVDSKIYFL